MSLMASFSGFDCPKCGNMVMASEVKGLHEPSLAVATCEWCGAELQVETDHAKRKITVKRLKKN